MAINGYSHKIPVPSNPADRHQLKVARDSMRMNCPMMRIMGGPNHYEAASIIHRLTGVFVNIDAEDG